MKSLKNQAKQLILNMVIATMPKINVKSGLCRYNFHCHHNTVHDALTNNQDKIAMVFYIDDGYPIIHFLNVDKKGNFIDNTLGKWSEIYDYYLIRYIEKESFFSIQKIFSNYRLELHYKLPFYIRWFCDIEF